MGCGRDALGATAFSVYNTFGVDTVRHVLTNSGARVLVVEQQFLDVVRAAIDGTMVEHLICIDADEPDALAPTT